MFDADILLYVGISCQPGTRWDQELRAASWSPRVHRQTVLWYDSRPQAEEAEKTVGGHSDLPAGGHEEDPMAITERDRIR